MPGKGRGLLAGRSFRRDEVVDLAPVIVIPARQAGVVGQTVIARFTFAWDEKTGSVALALGRVSLLNHSYMPNVAAEKQMASRSIRFYALRDICPGEELTINYHGDPTCRDPMDFRVTP